MPKFIALLGCTGSIGRQTLSVVKAFPDKFKVVSMAASGRNLDLLAQQVEEFLPSLVAVADEEKVNQLRELVRSQTVEIVGGQTGVADVATHPRADIVVSAISGVAGLLPTLQAIAAGKDIALANKETLVAAGQIVTKAAKHNGVKLIPVDSEHSAIFQCLEKRNFCDAKIILTASGGPFRKLPRERLLEVTPSSALQHPNWEMGKKITVDSATLMNKGLEVIEAHWLFGKSFDDIEVVVHPESIIHSMVQYNDGSIIAQAGCPDMRIPIQYALTWPERWPNTFPRLDLTKVGQLTFEKPRWEDFPCLRLAYRAGREGGVMPAVLNGANELAVELFLEGSIGFLDIPRLVEGAMRAVPNCLEPNLDEILVADKAARQWVRQHS